MRSTDSLPRGYRRSSAEGDEAVRNDARPRMTASEVTRYLDDVFPQRGGRFPTIVVEDLWARGARLRMKFEPDLIRPGGTIHGPAMFMLADLGMYAAILGTIGPVPLAVTTNLCINFLRRPAQRDMLAAVSLIKLGRRLAVGEVDLISEGEEELAAHATATYSIPPDASG